MFASKVFVVTGASSGIGAEAARHLAALRAQLVLVGRNVDNLNQTSDACRELSGRQPLAIVADVTRDDDARMIVRETKKRFGRLDVLVNNAGIASMDNILNLRMEKYDEIMNTNLRAVFNLTHLAVPSLIESKGSIINISSALGVKPSFNILSYSISKAALNAFTEAVALYLAPKKVRANAVVLGYARTNIHRNAEMEGIEEKMVAAVPMREAVDVLDVAKLIAYLASDDAKSITGHCLAIDGGVSAS